MGRNSLEQLKTDAREELKSEVIAGNVKRDNIDRFINEEADSQTPVMNATLLEMAAADNEIALRVPECGPAFDGTETPVNIIAANIYELITEDLSKYWHSLIGLYACEDCEDFINEDDLELEDENIPDLPDRCPECGGVCVEIES